MENVHVEIKMPQKKVYIHQGIVNVITGNLDYIFGFVLSVTFSYKIGIVIPLCVALARYSF